MVPLNSLELDEHFGTNNEYPDYECRNRLILYFEWLIEWLPPVKWCVSKVVHFIVRTKMIGFYAREIYEDHD